MLVRLTIPSRRDIRNQASSTRWKTVDWMRSGSSRARHDVSVALRAAIRRGRGNGRSRPVRARHGRDESLPP